jgi:hypothetical protein
MKTVVIVALALACGQAVAAAGDEIALVGRFDNVASSDQGEHCSGYSLDLWESRGRPFGLLHHHSGLCGDPPCSVIENAALDDKTGRLTFNSAIRSQKFEFAGFVQGKRVVGKLNGREVQLDREPPVEGFDPDSKLAAWCSFWQSVPRCTGVKKLCGELQ